MPVCLELWRLLSHPCAALGRWAGKKNGGPEGTAVFVVALRLNQLPWGISPRARRWLMSAITWGRSAMVSIR